MYANGIVLNTKPISGGKYICPNLEGIFTGIEICVIVMRVLSAAAAVTSLASYQ